MPTTTIAALPVISPVRDPLNIAFQDADNLASDNLEPTELEVQVEVEDVAGSNIWRRVGEMLNPYGPDNTASVLIHRALMGTLKPTPPSLTAVGLQSFTSICKKYRLLARDIVGGVPAGVFNNAGSSQAWLAGQSYTRQSNDLYQSRAYRFLTTQGSPRYIHPDQRIFVPFLTFIAGTGIQMIITATYTDATTEEFITELGDVTAFTGYYMTVPTPVWTKPIASFNLRLFGFLGASMESMNYYYTRDTQWKQEIFYLNSRGGIENFMFTGKTEESHTDTGEIFEGQLFPPLDAQEGNYITFNQRGHESFVLRSGWISLVQREFLKDLTLRNEAYLVVGTALRKLIITNATYQTRKDGEFLYSLELQARFAYDHHAY